MPDPHLLKFEPHQLTRDEYEDSDGGTRPVYRLPSLQIQIGAQNVVIHPLFYQVGWDKAGCQVVLDPAYEGQFDIQAYGQGVSQIVMPEGLFAFGHDSSAPYEELSLPPRETPLGEAYDFQAGRENAEPWTITVKGETWTVWRGPTVICKGALRGCAGIIAKEHAKYGKDQPLNSDMWRVAYNSLRWVAEARGVEWDPAWGSTK